MASVMEKYWSYSCRHTCVSQNSCIHSILTCHTLRACILTWWLGQGLLELSHFGTVYFPFHLHTCSTSTEAITTDRDCIGHNWVKYLGKYLKYWYWTNLAPKGELCCLLKTLVLLLIYFIFAIIKQETLKKVKLRKK